MKCRNRGSGWLAGEKLCGGGKHNENDDEEKMIMIMMITVYILFLGRKNK